MNDITVLSNNLSLVPFSSNSPSYSSSIITSHQLDVSPPFMNSNESSSFPLIATSLADPSIMNNTPLSSSINPLIVIPPSSIILSDLSSVPPSPSLSVDSSTFRIPYSPELNAKDLWLKPYIERLCNAPPSEKDWKLTDARKMVNVKINQGEYTMNEGKKVKKKISKIISYLINKKLPELCKQNHCEAVKALEIAKQQKEEQKRQAKAKRLIDYRWHSQNYRFKQFVLKSKDNVCMVYENAISELRDKMNGLEIKLQDECSKKDEIKAERDKFYSEVQQLKQLQNDSNNNVNNNIRQKPKKNHQNRNRKRSSENKRPRNELRNSDTENNTANNNQKENGNNQIHDQDNEIVPQPLVDNDNDNNSRNEDKNNENDPPQQELEFDDFDFNNDHNNIMEKENIPPISVNPPVVYEHQQIRDPLLSQRILNNSKKNNIMKGNSNNVVDKFKGTINGFRPTSNSSIRPPPTGKDNHQSLRNDFDGDQTIRYHINANGTREIVLQSMPKTVGLIGKRNYSAMTNYGYNDPHRSSSRARRMAGMR